MRIGLFGFGAVSSSIYHELNKYEDLYILIDENRLLKYKDGITINDKIYHPKFIIKGKVDVVFVAVKNYDLDNSLNDLEKFIDDNTIIIPLLNGIEAHDIIQNRFKNNKVLYGLIFVESNKNGTNIHTSKIINIFFGNKENKNKEKYLLDIKEILDRYDINNDIPENMIRAIWSKWMLNIGINQISALLNATYKQMYELKDLLYKIFEEVYLVSKAYNIGLTEEDVLKIKKRCDSFTSDRVTSLTIDFYNNDKNEMDVFGKKLIELAKNKNISIPVNETLYSLLKSKNDYKRKKELLS